jgi:hypothetical protein
MKWGHRWEGQAILVEELREDAALGGLIREALAPGYVGLVGAPLLVEALECGHEA